MITLPQPRITQIRAGTVGGLLLYLALAWLAGGWLRLVGVDLWVLRIGLSLIGLVACSSGASFRVWLRVRFADDTPLARQDHASSSGTAKYYATAAAIGPDSNPGGPYGYEVQASQAVAAFQPSPMTIRNLSYSPE